MYVCGKAHFRASEGGGVTEWVRDRVAILVTAVVRTAVHDVTRGIVETTAVEMVLN